MKQYCQLGAICSLILLLLPCGCTSGHDISFLVEHWLHAVGTPAMAVAVVDSTHTLRSGIAGSRVVNGRAKITADDLWFIGSSSKTMTATLAALLIEQGKISWNTTVGESFPNLTDIRSEYKAVTLRELLSHRSGLPAYDSPEALATVPTSFPGDLMKQRVCLANWMLQQTPSNTPGTTIEYSNLGYFVAAVMLEQASGQTWEDSLQSYLLKPLNITAKFGLPGTSDATNQPWGHVWADSAWNKVNPDDPDNQIPEIANPVGNVSMTLSAYAKWAQINLAGLRGIDNSKLKASLIKNLHTVIEDSSDGSGQALAWYRNKLNNHLISTTIGSDDTFYGMILIDPKNNRGVVVLTNGTKNSLESDPVLDAMIKIAEEQLKR